MLTSTSSTKQAPVKVTIGGAFLAKTTRAYPDWRRAEDAVRWLRGELQIKPTIKLAAKVFRVSYPCIKQAQARIEQLDGSGTMTLSDSALERLVAEVGIDRVWRAVDKLTQPPLPLQAAE